MWFVWMFFFYSTEKKFISFNFISLKQSQASIKLFFPFFVLFWKGETVSVFTFVKTDQTNFETKIKVQKVIRIYFTFNTCLFMFHHVNVWILLFFWNVFFAFPFRSMRLYVQSSVHLTTSDNCFFSLTKCHTLAPPTEN